jgi:hypothetical protein
MRRRGTRGDSLRSADLRGSFWPSHRQELLLQVGLLREDADARAAWEALRPRLDIDTLEEGSYALLPLVYRRLRQLAISDPLLPRLRGVHRKTWLTNQASLSVLTRALQALQSTHVRTMIVNDASAALRLYPEPHLRPVTDIEVVIHATESAAAVRELESVGWHSGATASAEIAIASNAGLRFEAPDRSGTVILRAHPVAGAAVAGFPGAAAATRELWEGAVEADVEGTRTLALAPADELLYTCINGVRGRPWRTIQWVADATMIMRGGEVDWGRLVLLARQQRLGLPLRDALTYLTRLVDAPIPPACRRELAGTPVTRRESVAHSISSRGGRFLGTSPSLIGQYIRITETTDATRALADAPRFLKHGWGLAGWSDAPVLVARALVRQLRPRRRRARGNAAAPGRTN